MGICKEEEKIKIKTLRKQLQIIHLKFSMVPNNKYSGRDKAYCAAVFNNILFEVESDIDSIANIHMPFLKTAPAVDYTDF